LIATLLAMAPAALAAKPEVETLDLKPFSNVAYIPAGANASSLKVQSLKAVQVPTKRIATTDKYYCEHTFREPAAATSCSSLKNAAPVPAYRITYSFQAPAMASDEYGATGFTFSVYFRPDDLDPQLREAIGKGRVKKLDLERYFAVSSERGSAPAVAIDQAHSIFCEGNYRDGDWTRTDPTCHDKVTLKTVTVPSDYIAVKVTPISRSQKQVAATTAVVR